MMMIMICAPFCGTCSQEKDFLISEASDGVSGVRAFSDGPPHAVLLDLNMPRMNGIDTLTTIKQIDPRVPVIMLTAYGDIPTAVEAMRLGAYDFTTKPPEFDRLILLLKRAVEHYLLEMKAESANTALALSLESLLGKSSATKKVINFINHAAQTDLSVIIQGETGTGKTFVAEALHNLSKRANKPFVRVDIGLIPDSLIESELFGYKKGAFTGADGSKTGFFEAADGGTIFIDEVENMSPVTQSKLLTVIERKEIYPIGSTSPASIDIRIIAATNSDIRASIVKKEFREDLFYRLGGIHDHHSSPQGKGRGHPFLCSKVFIGSLRRHEKTDQGNKRRCPRFSCRICLAGEFKRAEKCHETGCSFLRY